MDGRFKMETGQALAAKPETYFLFRQFEAAVVCNGFQTTCMLPSLAYVSAELGAPPDRVRVWSKARLVWNTFADMMAYQKLYFLASPEELNAMADEAFSTDVAKPMVDED